MTGQLGASQPIISEVLSQRPKDTMSKSGYTLSRSIKQRMNLTNSVPKNLDQIQEKPTSLPFVASYTHKPSTQASDRVAIMSQAQKSTEGIFSGNGAKNRFSSAAFTVTQPPSTAPGGNRAGRNASISTMEGAGTMVTAIDMVAGEARVDHSELADDSKHREVTESDFDQNETQQEDDDWLGYQQMNYVHSTRPVYERRLY